MAVVFRTWPATSCGSSISTPHAANAQRCRVKNVRARRFVACHNSDPAETESRSDDVQKFPRRPLLTGAAAVSHIAAWHVLLPSQHVANAGTVETAATAVGAPVSADTLAAVRPVLERDSLLTSPSLNPLESQSTSVLPACPSGRLAVRLDILPACRLGVSYYPDFTYNPVNGAYLMLHTACN